MIEQCAGIDVGRKFMACVMVGDANATPVIEVMFYLLLSAFDRNKPARELPAVIQKTVFSYLF